MERGFTDFEHCFDLSDVDVENDEFEFEEYTGDGVCITSLSINDNQLLVGKYGNLPSFWLDAVDEYCLTTFMSAPRITIKNGEVSSVCTSSEADWSDADSHWSNWNSPWSDWNSHWSSWDTEHSEYFLPKYPCADLTTLPYHLVFYPFFRWGH